MEDHESLGHTAPAAADAGPQLLTFLIADVRGYTRFTHDFGDEAAAELTAQFARIVREAVTERAGRLLELRGDEAMVVFSSARQAVWSAVELQGRFQAHRFSDPAWHLAVGIGIDAGDAVPVEGGYRTGALNMAARLCGVAAAGEILLSETVASLAGKIPGLAYRDRGRAQLKGYAEPVHIIRVVAGTEAPATSRSPLAGRKSLLTIVGAALAVVAVAAIVTYVWSANRRQESPARPAFVPSRIGTAVAGWGTGAPPGAGLGYPDGVSLDALGNLYVADQANNQILKYSSSGLLLARWGSQGTSRVHLDGPAGLATDGQSDVYVADKNDNRIVKFSPAGAELATWGTQGSGAGQFDGPTDVALDRRGDVYVLDSGNSRVQQFSPTGKPLAEWGTSAVAIAVADSGDVYLAGPGNQLEHRSPGGRLLRRWTVGATVSGITIGPGHTLYLTDSGTNRIELLGPSGQKIATWGDSSSLNNPIALTVDTSGSNYAADAGNGRVRKLAPDGRFVAGWGTARPAFARLRYPVAAAADRQGDIYVADTSADRILVLSPMGYLVATWGSSGHRPGQFVAPYALAVDAWGSVYVADTLNNRIQKLSPTGKVLAVWGRLGPDPGDLDSPYGIAVDSAGDVYVADTGNNRIEKFSPDGHFLQQWGVQGAEPGQFDTPYAVTLDRQGNVYVADELNSRVQKFSPAARLLAQFGGNAGGPGGSGFGQLRAPVGVAVDQRGYIYVVDGDNDRVEKLSPSGKPLAVSGSGGSGAAHFRFPTGIALDPLHNVYIVDTGNSRIVKFITR